MREAYFKTATIASRSEAMLRDVPSSRHAERVVGLDTALLILDMQRVFLDEASHAHIPSAPVIVPGIQRLARTFFRLGLPVILTRHMNTPENAGQMSAWWLELIRPDSPESRIAEPFDSLDAPVIVKSQYDAFFDTPLESELHQRCIRQLVITGVMTHLCCESTARSAFIRGFEVFFPVDGTATYSEAHHRATLINLSHGFAVPTLIGTIQSQLENPG